MTKASGDMIQANKVSDFVSSYIKTHIFSPLDIHFAKLMHRLDNRNSDNLFLAAALASNWQATGHVCLDLSSLTPEMIAPAKLPPLKAWLADLKKSPVVMAPGGGEKRPLVLDENGRLYLYRYWEHEQWVACGIRDRCAYVDEEEVDRDKLREGLDRLFPRDKNAAGADYQRVAAATAVLRRFCVISGGPGTGKTHVAARVLVLLLEQDPDVKIAFAAQTGKAAARLQESIRDARQINPLIPDDAAFTLHRLLGGRPGSSKYRFNAENPLPYDVVVVDEASMTDIALMARLVLALPKKVRLILLGDRDQLASVEAGALLGDICDSGQEHLPSGAHAGLIEEITGERVECDKSAGLTAIQDSIVILRESRRFGTDSGIGALASAVNAGDADGAVKIAGNEEREDLGWCDLPPVRALAGQLREIVEERYEPYLKAGSVEEALAAFAGFRILCAHRVGPHGAENVNELARNILAAKGLLDPQGEWYHGRPVLVTRNDYNMRLFNGDVGIAWNTDDGLRVFFPDEGGRARGIRTTGMPSHETVFAMTIHKSQGSEFDNVLLMLSPKISRIITRELIYTGITRARERVAIWGPEDVFREGVSRRIERTSGLRDALWN